MVLFSFRLSESSKNVFSYIRGSDFRREVAFTLRALITAANCCKCLPLIFHSWCTHFLYLSYNSLLPICFTISRAILLLDGAKMAVVKVIAHLSPIIPKRILQVVNILGISWNHRETRIRYSFEVKFLFNFLRIYRGTYKKELLKDRWPIHDQLA